MEKNKIVTVRVNKDIYATAKAKLETKHISISEFIRLALEKAANDELEITTEIKLKSKKE